MLNGKFMRDFFSKYRRLLLITSALLATISLLLLTLALSYQARHRQDPTRLGLSFSPKYAQQLGLNWRETYKHLLGELKPQHLRLMSYWDEYEQRPGVYRFDDLDWQFQQAAEHNVPVSLAIGLRQPRWPECHAPEWARRLPEKAFYVELENYLARAVQRYKNHPSLNSWQLENEIANRRFATACPGFNRQQLQREYDLVKQLDPHHPVIISAGNQSGIPLIGPVGDKIGFSVYKIANIEVLNKRFYWHFWYVPSWWHALRAALVEIIHDRPSFIHELQAEPWGPTPTVELSPAEQAKSMNPTKLKRNLDFALKTGMKEIDLWGAEWWYWRLQQGDQVLWQTVKELYSGQN